MSDTDSTATNNGSESEASPVVTHGDGRSELSDEEIEQLEKEREERLDPTNRPTNAEVDNSGREWDSEKENFKYAAGEEPGAQSEPPQSSAPTDPKPSRANGTRTDSETAQRTRGRDG